MNNLKAFVDALAKSIAYQPTDNLNQILILLIVIVVIVVMINDCICICICICIIHLYLYLSGGEDNLGLRYLAALSLAPGTKPPISSISTKPPISFNTKPPPTSFNQLLRVETNLAGVNKQQFSSSSNGVSNQQQLLQSIMNSSSSSIRPPPVSPRNGQLSSSPHSPSSGSTERNSK